MFAITVLLASLFQPAFVPQRIHPAPVQDAKKVKAQAQPRIALTPDNIGRQGHGGM
jgi:hypothetical protein